VTTPPRRPAPRPASARTAAARTQPRTRTARPVRRPSARRPRVRTFRSGNPHTRLRASMIVVLVLMVVVAGRVIELQVIQGPSLAAAAFKDRSRTVTIPAERGIITDRNGVALATTVQADNITADQTLVKDPAAAAAALVKVLGGDKANYEKRLTGTRRFIYISKGVTPQIWAKVRALKIPGLFSEATTKRIYPDGQLAANVVGFVGGQGAGLAGMEYALNSELSGSNGTMQFQQSAHGQQIPTAAQSETAPVAGVGIQLTIDADLQWTAQQALAQQVKAANADSGIVVVMQPSTGKILALATAPTFDPNNAGNTPSADLGNRALSDAFEPGSTSKLMTMAAAINEGAVTAETPLTIPASGDLSVGLRVGGKVFHDSEGHGIEKLTTTGVLARSSNIGAILTAQKIGEAKFDQYLKAFGIGQPTGLRFPGENVGSVPALSAWSGTTFPTLAFGQGLSVNAVQAASIYATIANGGVRVAPSLINAYVTPSGSVQAAAAPASTRVVSSQTAATLRSMLESVVSDQGTAPMAKIPGYRVAGKTGTANRINPTCGCYQGGGYTASFIGMAPADNPALVVAVFLTNPRNGHFGGVLAAPAFKKVMTFGLEELGVPPTGTPAAHFPTTW
jgi:cell division protein FtsI (penicillin-binding protein 3)